MRNHGSRADCVLFLCLTVFRLSFSRAHAADDFHLSPNAIGLLINFSVPCDLHIDIAIPDRGGLLTPNLMAIGYQQYIYNGSQWVYTGQQASLYNKTLAKVGEFSGLEDLTVKFHIFAGQRELGTTTTEASVTVQPVKSVYQMFAIPLQLLKVISTSRSSNYASSDYVQRFGTQKGLPPSKDFMALKAQVFKSGFSAFYAFYLPENLSPQLASRVPRCGDERFYGLQFGRTPGF